MNMFQFQENVEALTIEIKKEFEDLPEDNPDLIDIKETRNLAGNSLECDSFNNSFHIVDVKTEVQEEIEKNGFLDRDKLNSDKLNYYKGDTATLNTKVKGKSKSKSLPNRTKVKCEQCGIMCRDKNGYKFHLMNHTGERPFKCDLCDKSYKKAMDLTYHMISHTDIENDNKNVVSDNELKPIIVKVNDTVDTKFQVEKDLLENVASGSLLKPKTESTRMKSETKENHDQKRKGSARYLGKMCQYCGKTFDSRKFKTHIMDHTGERPFQCYMCGRSFKEKYNLSIHIKSHRGNHDHFCDVCHKGFTVRSALRAHMRTHTKDKPYVCHVCGRAFSHHSSLRPHISIHSDECPFECDRCDRRFKTRKTLRQHKNTHDLEEGKGMQCAICSKVYKSREGIKEHLKSHRQNESEDPTSYMHSCEHCGKTYKHLISLKNHMRYHTNEMFECHLCDKAYVDKNHLRIHLRNHTGETPYTCQICDRKFRRRDSFLYHKKTHESDRATYKCELCDKVLACKSSLRAHQILLHSTEKKHQCNLCDQKFKLRYELTKHMRKHKQKGDVPKTDSRELSEAAPSVETDPSKAVCEICQAECDVEGLGEHMATHDVKPLKCECLRLFYSEEKYKKHITSECELVAKLIGQTNAKEVPIKKEA